MRPRLPEWQRVPTSDPEIDFQKNLAEELVFAWQDAADPDTKAGLERALFNVGVERLGRPGEIAEFDGSFQYTEDDVAEGEPVEIIFPGWQLTNPRGTSQITRARVVRAARVPKAKEAEESETVTPDGGEAPNKLAGPHGGAAREVPGLGVGLSTNAFIRRGWWGAALH